MRMKFALLKLLACWSISLAFLFSSEEEEVLKNPGAESGRSSWAFYLSGEEGGVCDEKPHEGKSCLYLKYPRAEDEKMIYISQALPLPEPGTPVKISVWVRTSDPSVKYLVYCDVRATKPGSPKHEWFSSEEPKGKGTTTNIDEEWNKIEYEFEFPADQNDKEGRFNTMCGFSFYLRLYTPGQIWFDDVSVKMTRRLGK